MLRCSLCAVLLVGFFILENGQHLYADSGDPIAVQSWPGGSVSIQTHWGLELMIDGNAGEGSHREREADRHINPGDQTDHFLSRLPNKSDVSWLPSTETQVDDPNAIHVKTIRQFGDTPCLLIDVDGVRIIHVPEEWFAAQGDEGSITIKMKGIKNPDLVILDTDDVDQLFDKGTMLLLKFVKPKRVLLNRFDVSDQESLAAIRKQFGAKQVIAQKDHNMVALSNSAPVRKNEFLVTATKPWEMPVELSELFVSMEKANGESQKVFARLSANQLNFKPANGTHTPRWNTEHMMGRQLQFFSQIYFAKDPTIPVMDLNPEQMPPDYVFAHPEWNGDEEARQMQRVSEFTRRFAYLLEGVDLDKKAPGSRWTLRGLLKQMDRHYGEHTANTVKKFELPGWPTND